MHSTMMDSPLSLNHLLERAGTIFAGNTIVSRLPDKSLRRHTYGEYHRRTRALAAALQALGLAPGDRVATLCWNHHAHLEAYFGIPAAGGVMHTLNLLPLGGIELAVDGSEVRVPETVGYKGMMLSGVPNLAVTLGYTNASWTLKADLVAQYVCRLLNYMDARGYATCTPRPPQPGAQTAPWLDLKSGYVLRSAAALPKQGVTPPWRLHQNYLRDIGVLRFGRIDDGILQFDTVAAEAARSAQASA